MSGLRLLMRNGGSRNGQTCYVLSYSEGEWVTNLFLEKSRKSLWPNDAQGGIRRGVRPRAAGSSAHRADASGVAGLSGRSTRMGLLPRNFKY